MRDERAGILFLTVLSCATSIALGGCGSARHLLTGNPPGRTKAARLAEENALDGAENIRATLLERAENASLHLVQIRDRERPHLHTRYDLTVVLVRGEGTLWMAGEALPMREGDVAFIPRGTVHFFVNEAGRPAVAVVSFAPPFDGPDQEAAP